MLYALNKDNIMLHLIGEQNPIAMDEHYALNKDYIMLHLLGGTVKEISL